MESLQYALLLPEDHCTWGKIKINYPVCWEKINCPVCCWRVHVWHPSPATGPGTPPDVGWRSLPANCPFLRCKCWIQLECVVPLRTELSLMLEQDFLLLPDGLVRLNPVWMAFQSGCPALQQSNCPKLQNVHRRARLLWQPSPQCPQSIQYSGAAL